MGNKSWFTVSFDGAPDGVFSMACIAWMQASLMYMYIRFIFKLTQGPIMAPYKGAKFYMEIYLDKHLLKQSATFCNITINTTFEINCDIWFNG